MAAKRKAIETLTIEQLGIDVSPQQQLVQVSRKAGSVRICS